MDTIPLELHRLVTEARKHFPNDEEAMRWIREQIAKHPDKPKIIDYLERAAIRGMIQSEDPVKAEQSTEKPSKGSG
jgi:hypothetical protein